MPSRRVHCGGNGDEATQPPPSSLRFMESYESRHSDHKFAGRVAVAAGLDPLPLRADSQAKYGALARSDAAAFMRFPPSTYLEKIWDHAAGAVIVQEAGGLITDAEGGALDFSRGRWLDSLRGGIVAGSPEAHAAILAAVRRERQAEAEAAAQAS